MHSVQAATHQRCLPRGKPAMSPASLPVPIVMLLLFGHTPTAAVLGLRLRVLLWFISHVSSSFLRELSFFASGPKRCEAFSTSTSQSASAAIGYPSPRQPQNSKGGAAPFPTGNILADKSSQKCSSSFSNSSSSLILRRVCSSFVRRSTSNSC